MSKALYFLPLIAEALRQADPRSALETAFREIALLGKQPEFTEGFAQFNEFMALAFQGEPMAAEHLGEQAESLVRRLIVEFCTGTFRGDNRTRDMALQLIESRQEWKTRFEQAQTAPDGNLDSIRPVIFLVTANEKPIGSIVIPSDATGGSLGLIAPGRHSLVLETGRMIWAGRLSSSHLLLQAAFQEEPLRMAADTEALSAQPTLVVSLLDGDAFLRVYPGFEAGRLEVELRQRPCHGGER